MADTSYVTQYQREAPGIEQRKLDLMDEANRLYGQPMYLPAIEAAGLSIGEQQAMDLARQGIGSFEPFIQGGSQAITQGMDLAQRGALAAGAIQTAPMFQKAQDVLGYGINTLAPMADYERLAGSGVQDVGAGIGRVIRAVCEFDAIRRRHFEIVDARDLVRRVPLRFDAPRPGRRGLGEVAQLVGFGGGHASISSCSGTPRA